MGLVGLGILIIAAVWIVSALFRFIFLLATAVPAFFIGLFKKEQCKELASIEWDSDTILGFVALTVLAALAIWLIFYLELPQATQGIFEAMFF